MTRETVQFPKPLLVWCVAFAYASFVAITFQKLLLPLLPGLHAGHGLLHHDAWYFHTVAVELAQRIHASGWSEWQLFPAHGATGNVGLLGALYALLGPDPAWFIPINAGAHALGAMMLYLIGPLLWPGNAGRLGGLMAAVLFTAFPSGLSWYAQNHRDAFSIAGLLIILFVWLQAMSRAEFVRGVWRELVLTLAGMALIVLVRPYLLAIVSVALFASWSVIALLSLKQPRRHWRHLVFAGSLVALTAATGTLSVDLAGGGAETASHAEENSWGWRRSEWLPEEADRLLERAAKTRVGLINHSVSVGAGSLVDGHRKPDSAASVLSYLPRALAVALFAPFPDSWTERVNVMRVVGAVETFVWYLLIPGVLLLAILRPTRQLVAGAVFCAVLLAVLGFVHANVGTLYRQRFGILFFFVLCGAVGLSRVILAGLRVASKRSETGPCPPLSVGPRTSRVVPDMTHVAAAGMMVLGLSFLWFLGFLVRDLLLLRSFGLNAELDALFSAAMVPMFFVTFLAMPLADAITMPFLRHEGPATAQQRERLACALLAFASIVLFAAGLVLVASAHSIAALIMATADESRIEAAAVMLRWLTPLLVFSGWTIIGNAVLNMLHVPRAAALAQLPTPAIAIISILIFVDTLGVYAAVFGMLAGMTVNIVLVMLALRRHGVRFAPVLARPTPDVRAALRNWSILAAAAFVACLGVPINYGFAGSLSEGAISAWALGSKMVQFFTGLGGLAIGAVILPYLGGVIARGHKVQVKNDLYFLLIGSTWISVLAALIVYEFADTLVAAVFSGGKAGVGETGQLASILKLGSLQLPFVAATMLILRFAAVSGASLKAVLAMSLGLAVNVILDFILVPQSGVLGIATAAAIGSGVSAITLLLATRRYSGLTFAEIALLLGAWFALTGLCVALHYRSVAAAVTAGVVLLVFAPAQWRKWRGQFGGIRGEPAAPANA